MDYENYGEVRVAAQDGWKRTFILTQSITQIGSAAENDIVLDPAHGGGTMAYHAQIICWPGTGHGYRFVNLGNAAVQVGPNQENILPPRAVIDAIDGMSFHLGAFTLTLNAGDATERLSAGSGKHIGLNLELPTNELSPKRVLDGILTVRNLGDQEIAQWELDLEGLPDDCYQIEPAPLLFPGAKEQIRLRLFHWGDRPVAGPRKILIRAYAPEFYPTEETTISRTIYVLPMQRYELRLHTPEGKDYVARSLEARAIPSSVRLRPTTSTNQAERTQAAGITLAEYEEAEIADETAQEETTLPDEAIEQTGEQTVEQALEEDDWWTEAPTPQPASTTRTAQDGVRVLRANPANWENTETDTDVPQNDENWWPEETST